MTKIINADSPLADFPPSFFLAGQTGSGKSHLMHSLLEKLESKYSSNDLKYALFDFKQVEFYREDKPFKGYRAAYLKFGVVTEPQLALERLEYLSRIADMRLRMNEHDPMLFIYIEECDAAYYDQQRFDTALTNILCKADEANMRVVYSTSRVSDAKALSDKLLECFVVKLVGRLASEQDALRLGAKPETINSFNFRLITVQTRK